jgi:hypothetical protein
LKRRKKAIFKNKIEKKDNLGINMNKYVPSKEIKNTRDKKCRNGKREAKVTAQNARNVKIAS